MKTNPTVSWIWVTIASLALVEPGLAPGQAAPFFDTVVPGSLNTTEGNSAGGIPFDDVLGSMRYQQVYDASEFSDIRNGGGYVSFIMFRTDGGLSGGYQTSSGLQVDLSTTQKGPDSLSPVFAQNVGPDDTVVRGARSITLAGSGGSTPAPFDVLINLDTPFYYNPAAGNLLLDVRNYSGPTTLTTRLALDAQDIVGDSVSSVLALNVAAQTADITGSKGFVTLFGIQPVPEPSTWLLLGCGLCVVLFCTVRPKKRRSHGAD